MLQGELGDGEKGEEVKQGGGNEDRGTDRVL